MLNKTIDNLLTTIRKTHLEITFNLIKIGNFDSIIEYNLSISNTYDRTKSINRAIDDIVVQPTPIPCIIKVMELSSTIENLTNYKHQQALIDNYINYWSENFELIVC